jgi:hypothetical protein
MHAQGSPPTPSSLLTHVPTLALTRLAPYHVPLQAQPVPLTVYYSRTYSLLDWITDVNDNDKAELVGGLGCVVVKGGGQGRPEGPMWSSCGGVIHIQFRRHGGLQTVVSEDVRCCPFCMPSGPLSQLRQRRGAADVC